MWLDLGLAVSIIATNVSLVLLGRAVRKNSQAISKLSHASTYHSEALKSTTASIVNLSKFRQRS